MKLMNKLYAASDRLLDRLISGGNAKAGGGPVSVACRCSPNPAICPGGHIRLCNGNYAGCC